LERRTRAFNRHRVLADPLLIRHPGHVRTRQQLMDDANVLVDDQTITSHVKRIRRKFVKADSKFDCLDTVYGAGYRWKPQSE
jgi:two-component system OmpR family response regulator